MPIERAYPDATLLKYDGTAFPGTTIVRELTPPYSRPYPELMVMANNQRAFSNVGDDQDYIDSMTVDAFRWSAVTQIKNNIAREPTHGIFMLLVPDLVDPVVDRYLVRFFEASFTPQTPRNGRLQIFRAQITEIEVLRTDQVPAPL